MTTEQIAETLSDLTQNTPYSGELTGYTVESILTARSNYPVFNLMEYCSAMGITVEMIDITTEESYQVSDVATIHSLLNMLLERYNKDAKLVYRVAGVHYTLPKEGNDNSNLSVKTLLGVLKTIPCDLRFHKN